MPLNLWIYYNIKFLPNNKQELKGTLQREINFITPVTSHNVIHDVLIYIQKKRFGCKNRFFHEIYRGMLFLDGFIGSKIMREQTIKKLLYNFQHRELK